MESDGTPVIQRDESWCLILNMQSIYLKKHLLRSLVFPHDHNEADQGCGNQLGNTYCNKTPQPHITWINTLTQQEYFNEDVLVLALTWGHELDLIKQLK